MFTFIKFDGKYFSTLVELGAYVANAYGSWAGVPQSHPQYQIAAALAIINIGGESFSQFLDENGIHWWEQVQPPAKCQFCGAENYKCDCPPF